MSDCCSSYCKPQPSKQNKNLSYYWPVLGAGVLTAISYGAPYLLNPLMANIVVNGAVVLAALPLLAKVINSIKQGTIFTVFLLMVIAPMGALFINAQYEAIMVLFLYYVGEAVERFASFKANSGMQALLNLRPETVRLVSSDGETTVPIANVKVGDVVEVHPGERIPLDGLVQQGSAFVDQSSITGESQPIAIEKSHSVYGGSLVSHAPVKIAITNAIGDSLIDTIIQSVNNTDNKAHISRTIDAFAKIFVPLALVISLCVVILPPLIMGYDWQTWIYRGLTVLLICCPCALVISTPAATSTAMALSARMGILFRGGLAMETIGKIRVLGVDKTGTLTMGTPAVHSVVGVDCTAEQTLSYAMVAEHKSTHPIASAIIKHGQTTNVPLLTGSDWKTVPGKGVFAKINKTSGIISVAVVSPAVAKNKASNTMKTLEQDIITLQSTGKTVSVVIVDNDTVAGYIATGDSLRPQTPTAIDNLKALGITPVMITGDNTLTAQYFAHKMDMAYYAHMLPQDKVTCIENLKKQGYVAMVGDGINDTPSLKVADISIAMGSGTDIAMDVSQVALISNNPLHLVHAVVLSRKTIRTIKQNIFLALSLKSLVLLTSILGYTGMWVAVLADTGATVLVVLNSVSLFLSKVKGLPITHSKI